MRHLANAPSVTGHAGSICRTSFSGVWQDRSRLIYLLNLQVYVTQGGPLGTSDFYFKRNVVLYKWIYKTLILI